MGAPASCGGPASWRLRLAWKILVVAYVGLGAASWGILSQGVDLRTANGRHLLAGALANLCFVLLAITVTANAYRRGQRWAWLANTIVFLYGIPMVLLDSYHVGFWSPTVAPQALGGLVALTGLVLPFGVFWGERRR